MESDILPAAMDVLTTPTANSHLLSSVTHLLATYTEIAQDEAVHVTEMIVSRNKKANLPDQAASTYISSAKAVAAIANHAQSHQAAILSRFLDTLRVRAAEQRSG